MLNYMHMSKILDNYQYESSPREHFKSANCIQKLIIFNFHLFYSLGGWVATRASGMKKNKYGNIEDLVIRMRMVTGRTTDPVISLERNCLVPRASCGPDFDQIILGSEGTLGVITEVVLKIKPLPRVVKYGSIVFPNFQSGVQALCEVRITQIDSC